MCMEKLKELLADHLNMDVSEISDDMSFEDLGIDSLDVAEIMMEVEDTFGIEVQFEDVGKTVESLAAYIDSKTNE